MQTDRLQVALDLMLELARKIQVCFFPGLLIPRDWYLEVNIPTAKNTGE
jgi:hypothetical protein